VENGDTKDSQGETPSELSPGSAKNYARKESSKSNKPSQKPTKQKKHGLWRNWKSQSRTRQVELIFLGLVATGGIGYLFAYITFSNSQGKAAIWGIQVQHRPVVAIIRPELQAPFTCDMSKGTVDFGEMRVIIQNFGNAYAKNVISFGPEEFKAVPETKFGDPMIDNPQKITEETCSRHVATGMPADGPTFTIPPNTGQYAINLRQASAKAAILGKDTTIMLYAAPCVYYSDEYGIDHGTCDRFRFYLNGKDSSFICTGKPMTGTFAADVGGHCSN
jgi:hypothetical protein